MVAFLTAMLEVSKSLKSDLGVTRCYKWALDNLRSNRDQREVVIATNVIHADAVFLDLDTTIPGGEAYKMAQLRELFSMAQKL